MNNRAQISIEFIVTIMFIIGIFMFSLFLFQNRTILNQNYAQQWEAREIAVRFARNINNVYLMDENSVLSDYFFWDAFDGELEFSERSVKVYYFEGAFVDFPINAIFESNITDLNGQIFFKKENSKVVISYE